VSWVQKMQGDEGSRVDGQQRWWHMSTIVVARIV